MFNILCIAICVHFLWVRSDLAAPSNVLSGWNCSNGMAISDCAAIDALKPGRL